MTTKEVDPGGTAQGWQRRRADARQGGRRGDVLPGSAELLSVFLKIAINSPIISRRKMSEQSGPGWPIRAVWRFWSIERRIKRRVAVSRGQREARAHAPASRFVLCWA